MMNLEEKVLNIAFKNYIVQNRTLSHYLHYWPKPKTLALHHSIKTAIAATIAAAIYLFFGFPNGYWTVISAVVVMQSSIDTGSFESTTKIGLQRILGTLVGVVIGFIALFTFTRPSILLGIAIIFVVIGISTYLASRFSSLKMAGVTATIVILSTFQAKNLYFVAFTRSFEIILGAIIAVLVTIIIWPHRLRDYFLKMLRKTLKKSAVYYRAMMDDYLQAEDKELQRLSDKLLIAISKNHSLLKEMWTVSSGYRQAKDYCTHILHTISDIFIQLQDVSNALNKLKDYSPGEELKNHLEQLKKSVYVDFQTVVVHIKDKSNPLEIQSEQAIKELETFFEEHKEIHDNNHPIKPFKHYFHTLIYTHYTLIDMLKKLSRE